MTSLESPYTAHVDEIAESEWSELLLRFDDASLYQTWSYGAVCWKGSQLSHLVLKKGGEVAAMAQVRIVRLPVLGKGIAYVRWGPLWRLHDQPADPAVLRQAMLALKAEYADRRRLLLRVVPNSYAEDEYAAACTSTWSELGFRPDPQAHHYRTMRVDLGVSVEQLRRGLHQRWRNYLKNAEKSSYEVVHGANIQLYDRFLILYREMMARKQFDTTVDVEEFRALQQALPDSLKMQVFVCEQAGHAVNALVVSTIGDSPIYLLAATGDAGLKGRGAYLLQWRAMEWLKERGHRWYDVGGINPDRNPGVFQFKSGLGGQEVHQLGGHKFGSDRVNSFVVACGERLRGALRHAKARRLKARASAAS